MGRVISTALQFIDGFTKPSKAALDSMKKMGNDAIKAGKQIQSAGKAISSVGSSLSKSITLPIAGVAAAAIKTAADFEEAMTEVKVVAGATGKEFEALKQEAKHLGATTKFSAIESAEAMQYMAQAGWDTQAILEGTAGVMNAAASSGEDLASVAGILSKNITAFGDTAKDASRYADVLAAAAAVSAADVNYLGEGFKYAASTAGAMNYSVEDVSIALAAMSQSGIEAGTAGAALRNIISNMASPSKKQAEALKQLNLSLTDSKGNTKDFATVMNELRYSFSGLTESQAAAFASTIAGKQSMASLLALVNTSDADFATFTNAINNSAGTAENMAKEMQDNLNGQIVLLKSGLEGIAITIGDKLMPYIKTAVSWVQKATDYINNLSDAQVSNIMKWAGIAAAIGPVLLIFGKMVTTIGNVKKTYGAMTKTIANLGGIAKALTSPAGIVIGVLAAIAIAAILIIKNWDKVKGFLSSVGAWFKSAFEGAGFSVEKFKEKFSAIGGAVKGISDKIAGFCKGIAAAFKKEFAGSITTGAPEIDNGFKKIVGGAIKAFDGIVTAVEKGMKTFDALLEFFGGAFTGNWESATQGFKQSLKNIFPPDIAEGLIKGFDKALPAITAVVEGIKSSFGGLVQDARKIFDSFKSIFGGIGTLLKGIFTGDAEMALGGFKTAIKGVLDTVSNLFKARLNMIKNFVVGALSTFLPESTVNKIAGAFDTITAAWDIAINGAKVLIDSFIQTIKPILGNIKTILSGISQFIKGVFTGDWKGALNGLKTIASGVLSALVNIVKAPFQAIGNAVKSVISGFKNMNIIKTIFGGIGNAIKKVLTSCGVDMNKFSANVNNIKARVGSIINNLRTIFGVVFGAIGKFVRAAATVVANIFGKKISDTCSTAGAVIRAFGAVAVGIFNFIASRVKAVMSVVVPVVKVAFSAIAGGISAAVQNITAIISGLLTIFDGITMFISGVFTGNWSKAWEGIKTIFKGVFDSLAALCKTPINAVIGIINGAINGINKLGLTIPDWVPMIGGKSFSINIPTLPMLYKGTDNWQGGRAIVHDRGGEIIDLPKGSRVYPHDKSVAMARKEGAAAASKAGEIKVIIQKLADKIEIRSDEDIDRIAKALARELKKVALNTGIA